MGDRVVDCARLESVCAERHRGFESLPIRSPRRPISKRRLHNSFTITSPPISADTQPCRLKSFLIKQTGG